MSTTINDAIFDWVAETAARWADEGKEKSAKALIELASQDLEAAYWHTKRLPLNAINEPPKEGVN